MRGLIDARPFGQSLLIVFAAMGAAWMIALYFLPPVFHMDLGFSDVPAEQAIQAQSGSALASPFEGCYWGEVPDNSADPDNATEVNHRVFCVHSEVRKQIDHEYPLNVMQRRFEQAPGWQVVEQGYTASGFEVGPLAYLVLLIPLGVAFVLIRRLDLRQDIGQAARLLLKAPWVLALVPATMFVTLLLTGLVFASDSEKAAQELQTMFQDIRLLIGYATVMAILEEAAFREWSYRRTIDKLPLWAVAIGSSWFFMLAHILNPQAFATPGYLPAVFFAGLTLFWIRHRFGSFSLVAISHVFNNLFFIVIGILLVRF
jgi:membrane protease YdiL (CAAX protease family)